MNILWLAWKDFGHPKKGGAELVLEQLINRQAADGHTITLLTASYAGAPAHEYLPNGVEVIRVGSNRYLHPLQALWYYIRHLRGTFDIVVETVNTSPYFSLLFKGRSKGIALYHQLARDIWYFETKSPLSHLGYFIIEPISTWLLSRAKAPLVTVSESTKKDLARFGWPVERTYIISEGICVKPLTALDDVTKYHRPTILSFGALRGMKRTIDQIKAFEQAALAIPNAQLKIAGDASDKYGQKVLEYIAKSPQAANIEYLGRVTDAQKAELMRRSHVIIVTSVKEGWGLIVTEAASQGTPAVVYDVDGLRDSVRHGQTGFVTKPSPTALAVAITSILNDQPLYNAIRHEAWQWSKQMTFDQSYKDFKRIVQEAL